MAEDMPKCPPSGVVNEARPEEIWSGRVSQRLRSEWQPVWIKVNKATLSSYKSEYQDRDKPTVSFNLSTFEIHIEFHSEDANHFHMVLVNGASQIAFRFINAQEIAKVAKGLEAAGISIYGATNLLPPREPRTSAASSGAATSGKRKPPVLEFKLPVPTREIGSRIGKRFSISNKRSTNKNSKDGRPPDSPPDFSNLDRSLNKPVTPPSSPNRLRSRDHPSGGSFKTVRFSDQVEICPTLSDQEDLDVSSDQQAIQDKFCTLDSEEDFCSSGSTFQARPGPAGILPENPSTHFCDPDKSASGPDAVIASAATGVGSAPVPGSEQLLLLSTPPCLGEDYEDKQAKDDWPGQVLDEELVSLCPVDFGGEIATSGPEPWGHDPFSNGEAATKVIEEDVFEAEQSDWANFSVDVEHSGDHPREVDPQVNAGPSGDPRGDQAALPGKQADVDDGDTTGARGRHQGSVSSSRFKFPGFGGAKPATSKGQQQPELAGDSSKVPDSLKKLRSLFGGGAPGAIAASARNRQTAVYNVTVDLKPTSTSGGCQSSPEGSPDRRSWQEEPRCPRPPGPPPPPPPPFPQRVIRSEDHVVESIWFGHDFDLITEHRVAIKHHPDPLPGKDRDVDKPQADDPVQQHDVEDPVLHPDPKFEGSRVERLSSDAGGFGPKGPGAEEALDLKEPLADEPQAEVEFLLARVPEETLKAAEIVVSEPVHPETETAPENPACCLVDLLTTSTNSPGPLWGGEQPPLTPVRADVFIRETLAIEPQEVAQVDQEHQVVQKYCSLLEGGSGVPGPSSSLDHSLLDGQGILPDPWQCPVEATGFEADEVFHQGGIPANVVDEDPFQDSKIQPVQNLEDCFEEFPKPLGSEQVSFKCLSVVLDGLPRSEPPEVNDRLLKVIDSASSDSEEEEEACPEGDLQNSEGHHPDPDLDGGADSGKDNGQEARVDLQAVAGTEPGPSGSPISDNGDREGSSPVPQPAPEESAPVRENALESPEEDPEPPARRHSVPDIAVATCDLVCPDSDLESFSDHDEEEIPQQLTRSPEDTSEDDEDEEDIGLGPYVSSDPCVFEELSCSSEDCLRARCRKDWTGLESQGEASSLSSLPPLHHVPVKGSWPNREYLLKRSRSLQQQWTTTVASAVERATSEEGELGQRRVPRGSTVRRRTGGKGQAAAAIRQKSASLILNLRNDLFPQLPPKRHSSSSEASGPIGRSQKGPQDRCVAGAFSNDDLVAGTADDKGRKSAPGKLIRALKKSLSLKRGTTKAAGQKNGEFLSNRYRDTAQEVGAVPAGAPTADRRKGPSLQASELLVNKVKFLFKRNEDRDLRVKVGHSTFYYLDTFQQDPQLQPVPGPVASEDPLCQNRRTDSCWSQESSEGDDAVEEDGLCPETFQDVQCHCCPLEDYDEHLEQAGSPAHLTTLSESDAVHTDGSQTSEGPRPPGNDDDRQETLPEVEEDFSDTASFYSLQSCDQEDLDFLQEQQLEVPDDDWERQQQQVPERLRPRRRSLSLSTSSGIGGGRTGSSYCLDPGSQEDGGEAPSVTASSEQNFQDAGSLTSLDWADLSWHGRSGDDLEAHRRHHPVAAATMADNQRKIGGFLGPHHSSHPSLAASASSATASSSSPSSSGSALKALKRFLGSGSAKKRSRSFLGIRPGSASNVNRPDGGGYDRVFKANPLYRSQTYRDRASSADDMMREVRREAGGDLAGEGQPEELRPSRGRGGASGATTLQKSTSFRHSQPEQVLLARPDNDHNADDEVDHVAQPPDEDDDTHQVIEKTMDFAEETTDYDDDCLVIVHAPVQLKSEAFDEEDQEPQQQASWTTDGNSQRDSDDRGSDDEGDDTTRIYSIRTGKSEIRPGPLAPFGPSSGPSPMATSSPVPEVIAQLCNESAVKVYEDPLRLHRIAIEVDGARYDDGCSSPHNRHGQTGPPAGRASLIQSDPILRIGGTELAEAPHIQVEAVRNEGPSCKPNAKRIDPPKDKSPQMSGILNVSLTPDGRWRRRYVALYPDTILIFPKSTSRAATARVRLTAVHELEDASDEIGEELSFRIAKRSKVTLYFQAETLQDFLQWTHNLSAELIRIRRPLENEHIESSRLTQTSPTTSEQAGKTTTEHEPESISSRGSTSCKKGSEDSSLDYLQPSLGDGGSSTRKPVPKPRTSRKYSGPAAVEVDDDNPSAGEPDREQSISSDHLQQPVPVSEDVPGTELKKGPLNVAIRPYHSKESEQVVLPGGEADCQYSLILANRKLGSKFVGRPRSEKAPIEEAMKQPGKVKVEVGASSEPSLGGHHPAASAGMAPPGCWQADNDDEEDEVIPVKMCTKVELSTVGDDEVRSHDDDTFDDQTPPLWQSVIHEEDEEGVLWSEDKSSSTPSRSRGPGQVPDGGPVVLSPKLVLQAMKVPKASLDQSLLGSADPCGSNGPAPQPQSRGPQSEASRPPAPVPDMISRPTGYAAAVAEDWHYEEPGSSRQSWGVKNMSNFWRHYQLKIEADRGPSLPHSSRAAAAKTTAKSLPDLCMNSSPVHQPEDSKETGTKLQRQQGSPQVVPLENALGSAASGIIPKDPKTLGDLFYKADDDALVCSKVPLKDRKLVFEGKGPSTRTDEASLRAPSKGAPKGSPHNQHQRQSWPSTPPNVNVRLRPEGPQPLALVGANSPPRSATAKNQGLIIGYPVKDLVENFKVTQEVKRSARSASAAVSSSSTSSPSSSSRPSPARSDEKVVSNGAPAQNMASSGSKPRVSSTLKGGADQSPSKVHQPTPTMANEAVAPYSYDDDSNGEIYTEVLIDDTSAMKGFPLFVVENGKEFPLEPLRTRKSHFEIFCPRPYSLNQPQVSPPAGSSSSTKMVPSDWKDYLGQGGAEPSKGPHMNGPAGEDSPIEIAPCSREQASSPQGYALRVSKAEPSKESVARSNNQLPYILAEREVLEKINVVSATKRRFCS